MAQVSSGQFKLWLGVMAVVSLVLTLLITAVKWLSLLVIVVAFAGLVYRNRAIVLSKEIFLVDFTDILFFLSCVAAIFFVFKGVHFDVKALFTAIAFLTMLFRKMQSRQPVLSELF
jgi:hypothetical protein